MNTADGCTLILYNGRRSRLPYGHPRERRPAVGRCRDCGCLPGHLHHYRCDVERCPFCYGQAISCDCGPETDPV